MGYAGPIEAMTITRAICAGYLEEPAECKRLRIGNFVSEYNASSLSFFSFLLIIGLIILVAFFLLQLYRRVLTKYVRSSIREEVMLEVKHQMDYAPLREA